MKPGVSVVIVSDYAGGESGSWDDIRNTLAALTKQDYEGSAEFLLCESAEFAEQIPADIRSQLPSLKVVLCRGTSSYEMKNEGAKAASADIVAMLDADCTPAPQWLRRLVETFETDRRAVTVSGRTLYRGHNLTERVLALLARSYLDPGRAKKTRYIANNNAGYRRDIYLAHPLPSDFGPFASRLQSEAILRSGGKLVFEPDMIVIHDFEGWIMEKDIRRNIGYGTIITRLRDRRLPYAWLTNFGSASIPLFSVGKTLNSWWDCIRCARYYGVRWYQLPIALSIAVTVNLMEIPGMLVAVRGRSLTKTAYR